MTRLSEEKAAVRIHDRKNKQSTGGHSDRLPVAYIASRQSDLTLALQAQQHSADNEQQPARRLRDVVGLRA